MGGWRTIQAGAVTKTARARYASVLKRGGVGAAPLPFRPNQRSRRDVLWDPSEPGMAAESTRIAPRSLSGIRRRRPVRRASHDRAAGAHYTVIRNDPNDSPLPGQAPPREGRAGDYHHPRDPEARRRHG